MLWKRLIYHEVFWSEIFIFFFFAELCIQYYLMLWNGILGFTAVDGQLFQQQNQCMHQQKISFVSPDCKAALASEVESWMMELQLLLKDKLVWRNCVIDMIKVNPEVWLFAFCISVSMLTDKHTFCLWKRCWMKLQSQQTRSQTDTLKRI